MCEMRNPCKIVLLSNYFSMGMTVRGYMGGIYVQERKNCSIILVKWIIEVGEGTADQKNASWISLKLGEQILMPDNSVT